MTVDGTPSNRNERDRSLTAQFTDAHNAIMANTSENQRNFARAVARPLTQSTSFIKTLLSGITMMLTSIFNIDGGAAKIAAYQNVSKVPENFTTTHAEELANKERLENGDGPQGPAPMA